MCLHARIIGMPENEHKTTITDHSSGTLKKLMTLLCATLEETAGVTTVRVWFGEQEGGIKTLFEHEGPVQEAIARLRREFCTALTATPQTNQNRVD